MIDTINGKMNKHCLEQFGKGRIYLKIGSTDDMSSYLAKLYQQTQRTSTSSMTFANSSLLGNLAYTDTVEISEDAYNSLASGNVSTMKPPPPPRGGPDEALQSLVDDGTITSDQASAIKEAIINAVDEESSSATSASASLSAESSGNPLKTLLNNLVSDGTLSEDQAASVADAMKPPPPPPPQQSAASSAEDSTTGSTDSDDDTSISAANSASSLISSLLGNDADSDSDDIDTILNGLLKYGSSTKEYISTLIDTLSADEDDPLDSLYNNLKTKSILTSDQLSDLEAIMTTSSSVESTDTQSV